jgi:hypothetical protein
VLNDVRADVADIAALAITDGPSARPGPARLRTPGVTPPPAVTAAAGSAGAK